MATDNNEDKPTMPEQTPEGVAYERREDEKHAAGMEAVRRIGGGDLRSDPPTIAALREGVDIERRLAQIHSIDHNGHAHTLLLVLETGTAGQVSARVLDKAICEAVDARAVTPRRRKGEIELGDLASFISYVNRMRLSETTVGFATAGDYDEDTDPSVIVIFDFDAQAQTYDVVGRDAVGEATYGMKLGRAGWRGDRARFDCVLSRQWKAWSAHADEAMSQDGFGDWIEANASDVTVPAPPARGPDGKPYPDATTLQIMARKLIVNAGVKVKREINPTTGTSSAVFETTHGDDSTVIHPAFVIGIPVFEGSTTRYEVECRVRFALDRNTGRAFFTYTLYNASQVYQAALKALREQIASECSIPVYVGTAPPPVTL